LPRALRRLGVDVFHAPADGGVPVRKNCPTVLTYHRALDKSVRYWIAKGTLPGPSTRYGVPSGTAGIIRRVRHDVFRQMYLRRADRVITPSEFAKWELAALLGVPEHKIDVIPLAADDRFSSRPPAHDIDSVRTKYGLPARYFVHVGAHDRWKNVAGLVRAFALARHSGLEDALVVVGSGDRADAVDTATSLGLREGIDIVFVGDAGAELPALYGGATAFVALSWGESFSLPIVEAMACGLPVIASRNSAIPEVLGDAGVMVDPANPAEAAEAMRSIADNQSWREDLRARSLTRSKAFAWRRTADRTAAVYGALLQ
jgi:glycosyltransferase involved in cell wall biosynthesis